MEIPLLADLQDLDSDNPGSWPQSVKTLFIIVVIIFTLGLGYYMFIGDKIAVMEKVSAEEQVLRDSYKSKHHLAVNLDVYREQMAQMEVQLAIMLKKLPAGHETPGLLDDITFVATAAGLKILSMSWGNEIEKEFYTELPLNIDVEGEYHQFGKFVSAVAELPRIVSLHDFTIINKNSTKLQFKIVAKTYRYKEE